MRHMASEHISDPSYGVKTEDKSKERERENERERGGRRSGSGGDDRDGRACICKYVLSSYERLEKRGVLQSPEVIISPAYTQARV